MKKQFLGLALIGLLVSAVSVEAVRPQTWTESVRGYFMDQMLREAAGRANGLMPEFLQGDDAFETTVRTVLFASVSYMVLKSIYQKESNAKKLILGLLGVGLAAFGVDNLRVNGVDVAGKARTARDNVTSEGINTAVDMFKDLFRRPAPAAQAAPAAQQGFFQRGRRYFRPVPAPQPSFAERTTDYIKSLFA